MCTWCTVREYGCRARCCLAFFPRRARALLALILQIAQNSLCSRVAARKNESARACSFCCSRESELVDPSSAVHCLSFELILADLSAERVLSNAKWVSVSVPPRHVQSYIMPGYKLCRAWRGLFSTTTKLLLPFVTQHFTGLRASRFLCTHSHYLRPA